MLALTVLGSSGSYCGPGRVCSSYLVESATTRVLVDVGNGSTANLQRHHTYADLDAVVVSHRHVDHCIDLVGAFHRLHHDPEAPDHLPLHAAAGVVDTVVGAMGSDNGAAFAQVFTPNEVRGGDTVEIGDLRIDFATSRHPVPTVSMRISDGEQAIAYSADSGGGEQLEAIAADADLFLCEATWQGDAASYPADLHLTAEDAGALAARAGVGHLVLTHVAGGLDLDRSRDEAARRFDGPLDMAQDNERYVP